MGRIERFEDIEAWKEARILAGLIDSMCADGTFARDYGLQDQIWRASVSVMSNIAEGFGAGSRKSFKSFLRYSYRSTVEIQNQLYIALDRKHIIDAQFNHAYGQAEKTKALIAGFIKHLSD